MNKKPACGINGDTKCKSSNLGAKHFLQILYQLN